MKSMLCARCCVVCYARAEVYLCLLAVYSYPGVIVDGDVSLSLSFSVVSFCKRTHNCVALFIVSRLLFMLLLALCLLIIVVCIEYMLLCLNLDEI